MSVIDVSAPDSPTVVGKTAPLPGLVNGVAVAGQYAYVAAGYAGLRVIDVSAPSAPVEVGFYDTPGYARKVTVVGDLAYFADEHHGDLLILRFAPPTRRYLPMVVR